MKTSYLGSFSASEETFWVQDLDGATQKLRVLEQ